MKHFDINLNIHYSAPQEIWDKIDEVYRSMQYWNPQGNCVYWFGEDVEVSASVEPSGIQFSGYMPEKVWNKWYPELKQKLSEALGYEIGEPEDGYKFKLWNK